MAQYKQHHISEFNTEGYVSMAFPTLFPTEVEILAPRQHSVTIGSIF